MSKDLTELSGKIQQQGGRMTPLALNQRAREWFDKNQSAIAQLMGTPAEARRLYLAVLNTVQRNPMLLEATPQSIFGALVQCAELRLYPGPLGEAALVPFRNGKTGQMEAQFMPMYQGLIKLAYQGGFIRKIISRVVWSNEAFEYECGSRERIVHIPEMDEEKRGERIGVYSIIKTKYGEDVITYLQASFVERIKNKSAASKSYSSPWNSKSPDEVDWMWKKTAVKQGLKMVPKSAELAQAIDHDNAIENPELVKPKIVNLDLGTDSSGEALEEKTGNE